MKVTKSQLKQIIKEELSQVMKENLDPEIAKVMNTIEYTVEDASEEGLDAETIMLRIRNLQEETPDHFGWLDKVDNEILMTAINTLLGIGPREYEYDPHADI